MRITVTVVGFLLIAMWSGVAIAQEETESIPSDPPRETARPERPDGPPPRFEGGSPWGPGRRGRHGPPHRSPHDPHAPLLRAIDEQNPDLARRLHTLREQSPERFHRVLLEALMFRLEEALDVEEARTDESPSTEATPRPPRSPHPGGAPPRPTREEEERRHELVRRQDELDRRSHELAADIRSDATASAGRRALLDELERVVSEHFEVRTQLRRMELEAIERELQHLREVLERMRSGMEHREKQRDAIIERRVRQLAGDDVADW